MMIDRLRAQYKQQDLLSVFEVPRSAYRYHCLQASRVCPEKVRLLAKIKAIHDASRGAAGSPVITGQLRQSGESIGRYKVRSLMKSAGLVSTQQKTHGYRHSESESVIAPNYFRRQFCVDQPDQIWCGDVTYVRSGQRWLYLATVLDVYKRKVVGWAFRCTQIQSSLSEHYAWLMNHDNLVVG